MFRLLLKFESPEVEKLVGCVFKEAQKTSSNIEVSYRVCALRTLTDVVQFSSVHFVDGNFEQYWSTFFQGLFANVLKEVQAKEATRYQQILENLTNTESEMPVDEAMSKSEGDENVGMKEAVEDNKPAKKKEEKMDDEEAVEDPALEKLQMVCLETIGKCWPYGSEIQGILFESLCEKIVFEKTLFII